MNIEDNIRPWDHYETLKDEKSFKVKMINAHPHERLSYQDHYKRDENWTTISGNAEVTVDGKLHELSNGGTIRINRLQKYTGNSPYVFLEVQRGEYSYEDDIVRFEDDYNRI